MGNACSSSHTVDVSHHRQDQEDHGMQTKSKPESQITSSKKVVIFPDQRQGEKQGKKTGLKNNDDFSNYINRAKVTIRTTTNADGGKIASQEDNVPDAKNEDNSKVKDVFSDYINHAKLKIRKLSSIGRSKSGSYRRE